MLKLINFFNWLCIGLLLVFILLLLLDANRSGGDAATRGLGSAFLWLSLAALAILLTLNLLPWNWSKYLAFVLEVSPLLFFLATSRWTAFQRTKTAKAEAEKPLFENPDLDRLARLIRDGEPESFQQALQAVPPEIARAPDLLSFALLEASSSRYRPDEKLQCVRLLVDAGAPLDSLIKTFPDIHGDAANTGNAAMLRFFFEHGVDPNALGGMDQPLIFDAIASSGEPLAAVKTFLEFGADPNYTLFYGENIDPNTPLTRAAQLGRWDVCIALINKGARAGFTTPGGKNCAWYMNREAANIRQYGSQKTRDDFASLQVLVGKAKAK